MSTKPTTQIAEELARKCAEVMEEIFTKPRAGQKMSNKDLAKQRILSTIPLTALLEVARAANNLSRKLDECEPGNSNRSAAIVQLYEALTNLTNAGVEL